MDYFKSFKINDHIYQIKDAMGVLMTLIIGDKLALLLDTGYGIYDIKAYISTITDKPLIVVASHGHMDHTGGNYLFDCVYISKLDEPLCILHNSPAWRKRVLNNAKKANLITDDFDEASFINKGAGHLKILEDNTCFDLGTIKCHAVKMEGHTKGSIGLLIENDKMLAVADATCPFVWLFLEESCSVKTYIKMLERIIKLDFDYILLGHGKGEALPRNKVYDFLKCAKELTLNESVKVSFHDFEDLNSYCYTKGKMYDQNDVGIVFDPNKVD